MAISANFPKSIDMLDNHRDAIQQAAERYGATNLRVFGSVARGEAEANSDFDILVDLEPGRSLFDLGGLLMELREILARDVDVVTEQGLRQRIREHVINEAVALSIPSPIS